MLYLYKTSDLPHALNQLGATRLRPWQQEPLKAIFGGDDVFVHMPTGGGKSLLFQLPALMEQGKGLTMVLSPLRALQSDQVATLQKRGIAAALLNADLSAKDRHSVLQMLSELRLLYLAPEQLLNPSVCQALCNVSIARIAIDEAHIIPQTMLDFRRAYGRIGEFIDMLPRRPQIVACTATATPKDRKRIVAELEMQEAQEFVFPIRRENLRLQIKKIEGVAPQKGGKKLEQVRLQAVIQTLEHWDGNGSIIIYCSTVKAVKRTLKWIKAAGWKKARKYTGKMSQKKRQEAQQAFLTGAAPIIVATNAFGLGIDKPDVRLVIHAGLPLSLDGYVQEIGRAGRDGKKAKCVLLYSPFDFARNARIIRHGSGKKAANRAIKRLNALKHLLHDDKCLWQGIERYFGEKPGEPCGKCQHCRKKQLSLEQIGI